MGAVDEQPVRAVAAFQTACWQQAYRGIVLDSYLDTVDATIGAAQIDPGTGIPELQLARPATQA